MTILEGISKRIQRATKTMRASILRHSATTDLEQSSRATREPWTESRINAIVFGRKGADAAGSGVADELPTIHLQSAPLPHVVATQGGFHLALRLEATLSREGKLIVFSGLTHQDGSSAVASQTATALAELGVGPVLLVDANLRAPRLQEIHSIPDTPGLLELLRHQAELDQALYPSPVKNLTVLPTAEAEEESASLLASGPMNRLVDALKQRYRFVIIDSSPLHGSIDSSLLASTADGMVIVAARGRRDAGELLEATRILNTVKARILGVVLSETSTG